jgi:ABC-type transport system involved in multi-copper enzyme maturation permease subunit
VTAAALVWGKLVASVAFLLLLIASALPLFAAVFLFGGIDAQQFVIAQLLTVVTALAAGSAALFWSALFRRTLISTVTSYGVTFAATVGSLAIGVVLMQLAYVAAGPGPRPPPDPHPLVFANPGYAMGTLLLVPDGAPLHLGRLLQLLFLSPGPADRTGPLIEPWHAALGVELLVVAAALAGTMLLMRARRGRES